MIRTILRGRGLNDEYAEDQHLCINADRAELESWLLMRAAFSAAQAISKVPGCGSDVYCVAFWDSQCIVVLDPEKLELEELEDSSRWKMPDGFDPEKFEDPRATSITLRVTEGGIYWTWYPKHGTVQYESTQIRFDEIEEALQ